MQAAKTVGTLVVIFIFLFVPFVAAHYFGSVAGFATLAAECVIGAHRADGADNGGFAYLFFAAVIGAFGASLLWLIGGVA